jgi:hypothetical protein
MGNKMDQVKIGVKTSATVHAFPFVKTFKTCRKTANKFHRNKSVQFLEAGYQEWILDSRHRRGSEVGSNTEVGNFTEEHHGLDEQEKRVCVVFWMICEDVRSDETLRIIQNGILERWSGIYSARRPKTFTYVVFEVLATEGKLGPNVTLINAVNPSTDRHDAIEENCHPPSTAPEFQFERILGWSKIRAW